MYVKDLRGNLKLLLKELNDELIKRTSPSSVYPLRLEGRIFDLRYFTTDL